MRIANVAFYLFMCFGDAQYPLVMVQLFSTPDKNVLQESSETVYLSEPLEGLMVVPISAIWTVVAMFPEMVVSQEGHIERTGKFSLMRHPYIELSKFSVDSFANEDDEEEDVE
jgi:hypothetical protein